MFRVPPQNLNKTFEKLLNDLQYYDQLLLIKSGTIEKLYKKKKDQRIPHDDNRPQATPRR